jgi:FemAB-related protein (PEP-CTERM system-associated)
MGLEANSYALGNRVSHRPIELAERSAGLPRAFERTMVVRTYDSSFGVAWDSFVFQEPEGTLFHLTAWKRAIERAFGFQDRSLLVEQGGCIRGVLPLYRISNWIQGPSLISTPFAVYGGICAADDTSRLALKQAACRIADETAVNFLELREPHRQFGDAFQTKELYVTFEQQLGPEPEELMRGFPKDTRYMIRKGQKNGLTAVTDNSQLGLFYDLYAESVRNLGTPVFSKRFFGILLDELKDAAEITVVRHGSKPLAAVMSFFFRDTILPYYAGSAHEGRQFAVNNFMYWDLLCRACEKGLRAFDFGRSKLGTGSYLFKTQWNMRERPLPYQYYLVKQKSLPNFSPVNPKFKLAADLWKKVPLPLTKTIGPSLVRLFP